METPAKKILVCVLAAMLSAGIPIISLAQAQNAVGGGASGGGGGVSATVLGVAANVSVPNLAPVDLPPQGGSFSNQVASASAEISPGVMPVFSTGLVVNTTTGTLSQNSAHAQSTSTVNGLNLLNGLVTASTIVSKATSDGNGTTATSSAAGSFANQLTIGGILYEQSEFAPNTTIAVSATVIANEGGLQVLVPLSGTVTINAQSAGGNGSTSSSLAVTFLQVNVSGAVTGKISLNASFAIASASSSVNFTSQPSGNHPPTLNVPGPQAVQVGTTLAFSVSATDPDAGDTVTLSASGVPANATFNQTTGNPASGQFSFTPSQSQSGQTITVNFTATDNHGASVSGSVQITVTSGPPPPTNHPPTLNLPGPQTVQAGATLTFGASATDPDAGDTVTLTASNLPPGASVTPNPASGNPASSQFGFTPSQSQAGQTFTVNFNATDNHGASTAGSVAITVTQPQNRPPVISVPGPQVIGVGKTLTFTVTASDPDGDAVTLSAGSVPLNASFNPSTGGFTFTPSNDQSGQTFVVTFTATDTGGASASATVPISVVVSSGEGVPGPPIISVPPSPIIVPVGDTLTFTVTATSPSASCAVVLASSGNPDNASFDAATGRFRFTPKADQKDKSFVVTFTATDCSGQKATATVTMIVVGPDVGGVLGPGRICVPVTKVFFGPTPVNGSCGFVTVSLMNEGAGNLTIRSISFLDGTHFQLEGTSGSPLVLQSAGLIQLKIAFQPKGSGTILDTLTIVTSDPDQPTVEIQLKGKGIK